jgi:hypothetical protein
MDRVLQGCIILALLQTRVGHRHYQDPSSEKRNRGERDLNCPADLGRMRSWTAAQALINTNRQPMPSGPYSICAFSKVCSIRIEPKPLTVGCVTLGPPLSFH